MGARQSLDLTASQRNEAEHRQAGLRCRTIPRDCDSLSRQTVAPMGRQLDSNGAAVAMGAYYGPGIGPRLCGSGDVT